MQLFRKLAEKRERDEREARMLVRRHGAEALDVLDDRIAKTSDSRAKSHWKRVRKIAKDAIRNGIDEVSEAGVAA